MSLATRQTGNKVRASTDLATHLSRSVSAFVEIALFFPVVLLVVAAVGKFAWISKGIPLSSLTVDEILLFVAVPAFELIAAACLAIRPDRMHPFGMFLFGAFFWVQTIAYAFGMPPCKCFGEVAFSRPIVLLVVVFAFAILVIAAWINAWMSVSRFAIIVGLFVFVGLATCFDFVRQEVLRVSSIRPPGPLVTDVEYEQDVPASFNYERSVILRNRSCNDLEIKAIMPSCACTSIEPARLSLRANESRSLVARIDLNANFRGGQSETQQSIEAICYGSDDKSIGEVDLFTGRTFKPFDLKEPEVKKYIFDPEKPRQPYIVEILPLRDTCGEYKVEAEGFDSIHVGKGKISLLPLEPLSPRKALSFVVAFQDEKGRTSKVRSELLVAKEQKSFDIALPRNRESLVIDISGNGINSSAKIHSLDGDEFPGETSCSSEGCRHRWPLETVSQFETYVADIQIKKDWVNRRLMIPVFVLTDDDYKHSVLNDDPRFVSIEFSGTTIFLKGNADTLVRRPDVMDLPATTLRCPHHICLCVDTEERTAWMVVTRTLWRGDTGGLDREKTFQFVFENGATWYSEGEDWRNREFAKLLPYPDDRMLLSSALGVLGCGDLEQLIASVVAAAESPSVPSDDTLSCGTSDLSSTELFDLSSTMRLFVSTVSDRLVRSVLVSHDDKQERIDVACASFGRRGVTQIIQGRVRTVRGLLHEKPTRTAE